MSVIASSTVSAIVRVVWSSILASVVVSVIFSVGIVGLIRAGELRRDGRAGAAAAFTAVGVCAVVICLATAAYGVILVGQKS